MKSAFYIPPTEKPNIKKKNEKEKEKENDNDKKVEYIQPFLAIIIEIKRLRRENPKGTIMNMLYKEMGNSIYGNVVRGLSNKKSFDTLTGMSFRVTGTDLYIPILASWTTAFVRSVIGECLHNISKLR